MNEKDIKMTNIGETEKMGNSERLEEAIGKIERLRMMRLGLSEEEARLSDFENKDAVVQRIRKVKAVLERAETRA